MASANSGCPSSTSEIAAATTTTQPSANGQRSTSSWVRSRDRSKSPRINVTTNCAFRAHCSATVGVGQARTGVGGVAALVAGLGKEVVDLFGRGERKAGVTLAVHNATRYVCARVAVIP